MREFSKGNSWHDNEGNLLVGRITFYKKNTTTKQDIYSQEGIVISNPIYTNQNGQTSQQVFLSDKDYLVVFDRYIGNGNMETDTNEEHWSFQYSCLDVCEKYSVDIDTNGLQVVNSIVDLRKTNPEVVEEENGNKLVLLAGYENPGDKPSVEYVWDENSQLADNGGSIVKVSSISIGRWVMVDGGDTVDVRHFGALPAISPTNISNEQAYKVQQANTYASTNNKKLYFPFGYYQVDTNISNVVCEGYILVKDNSNITIKGEKVRLAQKEGYKGNVKLTVNTLKMSDIAAIQTDADYSVIDFDPIEYFIIDQNVSDVLELENVTVEIQNVRTLNNSWINLTNCNVIAKETISRYMNIQFYNMEVNGNWFKDTINNHTGFSNCKSNIVTWTNKYEYYLYLKLNGDTIWDFDGSSVDTRDTLVVSKDVTIKNLYGASIRVETSCKNLAFIDSPNIVLSSTGVTSSLKLVMNYSSVNTSLSYLKELVLLNSSEFTCNNDITVTTTSMTNSGIVSNNDTVYNNLMYISCIDSNIIKTLSTIGNSTVNFVRCNINKPIGTNTKYNIQDCVVNSNIASTDVNGVIDFTISNTVFGTYGYMSLFATNTDAVVNGTWENVSGLEVGRNLLIDRTKMDRDETHHHYKWNNGFETTITVEGTIVDDYTGSSIISSDIVIMLAALTSPYNGNWFKSKCDDAANVYPTSAKKVLVNWLGIGETIDVVVETTPITSVITLGSDPSKIDPSEPLEGCLSKGRLELQDDGKYRLIINNPVQFMGNKSPFGDPGHRFERQELKMVYRIKHY